jgi:membrane protein implicated in regulation of membrane protease activity
MAWWIWILVGIALLLVEMATPGGLFALFFGAGAIVTGGLAALGFGPVVQWIAFTVVSLVLVATVRRPVQERLARREGPPVEDLVGETAVLLDDVGAGATGRAELRGTPWAARIASGIPLKKGQRCKVERVEGLTLWLRAE